MTEDTNEVSFSVKRKKFLTDQGYEYKIVTDIDTIIPPLAYKDLLFSQRKDQTELLDEIIALSDEKCDDEVVKTGVDDLNGVLVKKEKKKRNADGTLAAPAKTAEDKAKKEKEKLRLKNRSSLFKARSKGN